MSLLAGLSEGGRRALSLIKGGVAAGWTSTEIVSTLREHEMGYRHTTMLQDIRTMSGAAEDWGRMRHVRLDRTITERLYQERQFDRPFRYSTTIQVSGYSHLTGEEKTDFVTITHDTLQHREELEAAALEVMREESPDFVVETVMPVEGYRRA